MVVPLCFTIPFAIVGLAASVFYALNAYTIFDGTEPTATPGRIHQFWFNFLGSLFGWTALWFLIRKAWHGVSVGSTGSVAASDLLLAAFAFIGVTGHLPYATQGVLQGLRDLALKLAGLAK